MSRFLWLVLACLMVLGTVSPARAQTTTTAVEDQTTTTEPAETTTVPIPDPAVTTIPPEPEPPENAWTYRFLIPTAVLLSIVTALGIIVGYFLKVTRSRYRVVE